MAATVQVYSLTATWTVAQLEAVWKQMFIDAGLMSDWYDSTNSSSYYHRILRLTNDAAKTYGYQYIRFLFYTNGVWVQFANGWDVSTHVPTGTQYLDYLTATCAAATTGFYQLFSLSTATSYSFARYTSGTSTIITNGTSTIVIKSSIGTAPSWLDLDKTSAFSIFTLTTVASSTTNGWRAMYFSLPYHIQRALHGCRAYSGYANSRLITSSYCYNGVNTSSDANDAASGGVSYAGSFRLPSFASAVNPAYSSNYSPIVTGIELYPLIDCRLPNDFGFVTTLGLVPATRDTLTISAGVEVWEVIAAVAAASTNAMCLVARTT